MQHRISNNFIVTEILFLRAPFSILLVKIITIFMYLVKLLSSCFSQSC